MQPDNHDSLSSLSSLNIAVGAAIEHYATEEFVFSSDEKINVVMRSPTGDQKDVDELLQLVAKKEQILPFISYHRSTINRQTDANNRKQDLITSADGMVVSTGKSMRTEVGYDFKFVARRFQECEDWLEFLLLNLTDGLEFGYTVRGVHKPLLAKMWVSSTGITTPLNKDRDMYMLPFTIKTSGFIVSDKKIDVYKMITINVDLIGRNRGEVSLEQQDLFNERVIVERIE